MPRKVNRAEDTQETHLEKEVEGKKKERTTGTKKEQAKVEKRNLKLKQRQPLKK